MGYVELERDGRPWICSMWIGRNLEGQELELKIWWDLDCVDWEGSGGAGTSPKGCVDQERSGAAVNLCHGPCAGAFWGCCDPRGVRSWDGNRAAVGLSHGMCTSGRVWEGSVNFIRGLCLGGV